MLTRNCARANATAAPGAAACHTGGQNIIESEKTLEKEALVEYLKGGYNYDAIVTQVGTYRHLEPSAKVHVIT